MLKLTTCLLGIISSTLYSTSLLAQTALPLKVEDAFRNSTVPSAAMSAVVIPLNSAAATPVLQQNADASFSPASTMKLLTTLIALEELGPTFRWKTQFLADKPLKKEVLNGNLYLRGGGDPNLTWEKFSVMLRALRTQGIRKINGDLILDRSYFQPERLDIGAPPFDEHPDAYYNVIPDALLIHSNLLSFAIESTTEKIDTRLLTPLDKIKFSNHLHFNEKSCAEWESEWKSPVIEFQRKEQIEIMLSGGFPRRCKITTHLNIIERNQYIAHMFRTLWQEMGGTWQGQVRDGLVPANATLLHERASETLADTLRIVNKQSDNAMAKILFLTLGAESPDKINSNTVQTADARVRNWLAKQGINDAGLVLENGSGLSRTERISANQMAAILAVGARSLWNPEFSSSMPVAALDGTMRKRLKGSAGELRARIKTGTLKNTTAIAGYVRDIRDQQWIVVAMINHDDAAKAKSALDELLNWVAAGRP